MSVFSDWTFGSPQLHSYWRMDWASSTPILDSTGIYSGTAQSGKTFVYDAPGLLPYDPDPAMQFSNGYISWAMTAAQTMGSSWTWRCLINCNKANFTAVEAIPLWTNIGGTFTQLEISQSNGGLTFNCGARATPAGTAGSLSSSAMNVADGNTHIIHVTYDGATLSLYTDGTLLTSGSFPVATYTGFNLNAAGSMFMGNPSGNASPYIGTLDEVAFWTRNLSAAECLIDAQNMQNYSEAQTPVNILSSTSGAITASVQTVALPGPVPEGASVIVNATALSGDYEVASGGSGTWIFQTSSFNSPTDTVSIGYGVTGSSITITTTDINGNPSGATPAGGYVVAIVTGLAQLSSVGVTFTANTAPVGTTTAVSYTGPTALFVTKSMFGVTYWNPTTWSNGFTNINVGKSIGGQSRDVRLDMILIPPGVSGSTTATGGSSSSGATSSGYGFFKIPIQIVQPSLLPIFPGRPGTINSSLGTFAPGGGNAPFTYSLPGNSIALGQTLPVIARVFDQTGANYVTSFTVPSVPQLTETINGSGQPINIDMPASIQNPIQATPYATVIDTDTPELYWRVDETTGTTANDSSGNGNSGTLENGPSVGNAGATNDGDFCMGFNGVNSYIQGPELSYTTGTIELWVKTTSLPPFDGDSWTYQALAAIPGLIEVGVDSFGNLVAYGDWNSGSLTEGWQDFGHDTQNLGNGAWHHISVGWTAGTNSLYVQFEVDGIIWDNTGSTSVANTPSASGDFVVGAGFSTTPPGAPYNGLADEIAVYNYILGSPRILAHIASANSSPITMSDGTTNTPPIQPGYIVQLAEQGGDNAILFTGKVESVPINYGEQTGIQLQLNPIGAEAGYTDMDNSYDDPTELAQMVRDAVALTGHLWCTPQSVPDTGIQETYDFSQTNVADGIDTIRTLASPNYFWYIAPDACVWFQPTGGAAQYVVKQGQDYNVSNLNVDTEDMRNDITVVGGPIPGTGVPTQAQYYNAASVALYGDRKLRPNPTFPNITNQDSLQTIADNLGIIMDRIYRQCTITLINYPKRVNIGQPGGALLQYWQAQTGPMMEGVLGQGVYSASLVVQQVQHNGPTQIVTIDEQPTTIDDLQNYLTWLSQRLATYQVFYQQASLNSMGTVSGDGGLQTEANEGKQWVLDSTSFRAYDGTDNDYGAPTGGPGCTIEITSEGDMFIGGQAADITVNDSSGNPRVIIGAI